MFKIKPLQTPRFFIVSFRQGTYSFIKVQPLERGTIANSFWIYRVFHKLHKLSECVIYRLHRVSLVGCPYMRNTIYYIRKKSVTPYG